MDESPLGLSKWIDPRSHTYVLIGAMRQKYHSLFLFTVCDPIASVISAYNYGKTVRKPSLN
jgi:hypothetical protein